jgi:sugar phosphate isomerase/epimerase
MEFACHTWTFNDLTLPEALGTIARLGFRYVDIGSGPNLNAPKAAARPRQIAAEIREDLAIYNLKLSDLYLMLPRISFPDAERRDKDIELFKALIPFAAELKTPGITISPGVAQPPEDTEAFERTASALREMLSAAQEADLRLSIEPHMDSIAPDPEAALKLRDAVPGLEITLDWADLTCANAPYDSILSLLPHTRHIQIRQAARAKLQTPFERGTIDILRVLRDVRSAGYEGVICTEVLNMPGRHGSVKINPVRESMRLRDALRDARNALIKESA